MKQPTEQTHVLIKELHALLDDKARDVSQRDIFRATEIIKLISDSREWACVIPLLPLVTSPEKVISDSVCDAIENLLADVRPLILLQLDAGSRGGYYSLPNYQSKWHAMTATELKHLVDDKNRMSIIGLASFHRSGYVREAALKALSSFSDGEELPYLLIRLSDWVPQIREMAERAVEERINSKYLSHFITNLPLLEFIGQRKREDSIKTRAEIIGRITDGLKHSKDQDFLLDGLRHRDYTVRRACLNLMLDSSSPNWTEIVSRIISDRDVCIRRSAVDLACRLPVESQLVTLKRLAVDKVPAVRRAALVALCESDSQGSDELLKSALMDRSSIVREYARWKMAKLHGDFNFPKHYLDILSGSTDVRDVAVAVMGLGEVGKACEAQAVERFIDHPEVHVKKAVIRALAKLDSGSYVTTFLNLLSSENPGVSRQAQHALESTIDTVSSESLWKVFSMSSTLHVKRNSLILLNRMGKWERISYMLAALAQNDERVRDLAMEFVESWELRYRSTWQYTKPRQEQRERFISGMLVARKFLPEHIGSTLELCLSLCNET